MEGDWAHRRNANIGGEDWGLPVTGKGPPSGLLLSALPELELGPPR